MSWIPVESENYPDDMVEVQVTYLGYYDKKPRCNAFAYRKNGLWYWAMDEDEVKVKITAWRRMCEPYEENACKFQCCLINTPVCNLHSSCSECGHNRECAACWNLTCGERPERSEND